MSKYLEKAKELRAIVTPHYNCGQNGLTTTIRKSRGEDILAACGMLVNSLNSKL